MATTGYKSNTERLNAMQAAAEKKAWLDFKKASHFGINFEGKLGALGINTIGKYFDALRAGTLAEPTWRDETW